MKKLLIVALVATLLVGVVACNTINVNNAKAWLQVATNTFVAAMAIYNPGWNGAKLAQDANGMIAAWQVGVGWQNNVATLGNLVEQDLVDVPNCDARCQGIVVVFVGLVETGVQIAQRSSPTPVPASARAPRLPAGVRTYASKSDYKNAWNATAPPTAKLK